MNRTIRNILIVACAMLLAGAVFIAAAFALGVDLKKQWSIGDFSTVNIGMGGQIGYRDWTNAYSGDGSYRLNAEGVESVDLKWIAGNVSVIVYEGSDIKIEENALSDITEEVALRYGTENGTLYIQYCAWTVSGNLPEKNLTVSIPQTLAMNMDTFNYDASSADLSVSNLTVRRFAFDASSGSLAADDLVAETADLDSSSGWIGFTGKFTKLNAGSTSGTVTIVSNGEAESTSVSTSSGDVFLVGSFGDLTVDTTSGRVSSYGNLADGGEAAASELPDTRIVANSADIDTSSGDVTMRCSIPRVNIGTTSGRVMLDCAACPDALDIDTSSGDVALVLPENSGFSLRHNTSSGEFSCAFSVVMSGDKYTSGNGAADFSVNTSSGDLDIDNG